MEPEFFIVGAAKSGTTSIWRYLKQHPNIFFPENKEPNYFAYPEHAELLFPGPAGSKEIHNKLHSLTVTDWEAYRALFAHAHPNQIAGEASVRYLYFPQAAERIKRSFPDSRIIIILRHPVDRLYSHYLMMRGFYSLEPLSFDKALEAEDSRVAEGWDWDWHYTRVSRYSQQVKRYYDLFNPSQISVFAYEDFCRSPLDIITKLFKFLGVNDDFLPDMSTRSMQTYWPRSFLLHRLLKTPNWLNRPVRKIIPAQRYRKYIRTVMRINEAKPPIMPEETRARLGKIFMEDTRKLEEILERRMPWKFE